LSQGEGVIETERAVLDPAPGGRAAGRAAPERRPPQLAEGTELIGEYQGSGFAEPKYILRRADGQVIQLPRLLYLLAGGIDGKRDLAQVAARLSDEFGRTIDAEQVSYLLDNRLHPAGILAADPAATGKEGPARLRSDPLLSLRFRVGVVPERVSWVIAGIFQSFFLPPVVLVALAGFVALDLVLVRHGGLGQIGSSALALVHHPELTMLVLATVLASAMFHECGHVAACRYGGARPGVMGFGVYLVWPALYSTVTDAYRLSRRGRLRTDLGGVYFNVIFIAALSLVYLDTKAPWLLVAIALMHVETVRQFLPFIRLDGYYILSDLIGVPDLFSRMGPVLKSMIPGRPPHPRVRELKPWVRRVVTLWVIMVIPALIYFLLPFLLLAPHVLPVVWDALVHRGPAVVHEVQAGRLASAAVGVIQMFLLVLPWAAVTLIFAMMGRRLVHGVRGWARRRAVARQPR
jgi:putative peptide zinc metalloprotease protein